jgi:hypothetical protein
MAVIKITKADIEKLKTLDNGWYGATITKVSDPTPSKDKQSLNTIVSIVIDGVGKEINQYFNSKLIAMIIPLYEAVNGGKKVTEEFDLDPATMVGMKLDVKLTTVIYQGNPQNDIEAYLPYGQGANQKAPF